MLAELIGTFRSQLMSQPCDFQTVAMPRARECCSKRQQQENGDKESADEYSCPLPLLERLARIGHGLSAEKQGMGRGLLAEENPRPRDGKGRLPRAAKTAANYAILMLDGYDDEDAA